MALPKVPPPPNPDKNILLKRALLPYQDKATTTGRIENDIAKAKSVYGSADTLERQLTPIPEPRYDTQSIYRGSSLPAPVSTNSQNPAPVRSSGGVSLNSAGNVIPAAPAPSVYDQLKASLIALRGNTGDLYDETRSRMNSEYDRTLKDLYDAYLGSRTPLAEGAANLGVDFNSSTLGQNWDKELRRLNEAGELSRTSDLNWVDKMKALRDQLFESTILGAEQDQLMQAIAARTGGGDRSGGGSSGSSSITGQLDKTATETSTLENVLAAQVMENLLRTNPAAAAIYEASLDRSGGDYAKALADTRAAYDTLSGSPDNPLKKTSSSLINKFINVANEAANKKKASTSKNMLAALNALRSVSGVYTPVTKQVVTSKGTTKTKGV